MGNRDLIRVAVARDPRQATPLAGTFFGASSDNLGMTVSVDVREMRETLALDGASELVPSATGSAQFSPPKVPLPA